MNNAENMRLRTHVPSPLPNSFVFGSRNWDENMKTQSNQVLFLKKFGIPSLHS